MKLKYWITYVNKDGLRVLLGANQGRFFKDKFEEAQRYLNEIMTCTPAERLNEAFGPYFIRTSRTQMIQCYDNGDSIRTVFGIEKQID